MNTFNGVTLEQRLFKDKVLLPRDKNCGIVFGGNYTQERIKAYRQEGAVHPDLEPRDETEKVDSQLFKAIDLSRAKAPQRE